MRTIIAVVAVSAAVSIVVCAPRTANAQEPQNPYAAPTVVAPAPVVIAPAPTVVPPPAPPTVVAPPSYSPGYYYPPPGYAAPIYSYPPPPVYYVPQRPVVVRPIVVRPQLRAERARFFSLGLHGSVWGINQQINDKDVVLGGVGLQARFRTRGRFGLEVALDVLHGTFPDSSTPAPQTAPSDTRNSTVLQAGSSNAYYRPGPVERTSYPFTVSAMGYIFPNTDRRIFNLYFLGGFGLVSSTMKLTDEYGAPTTQDFYEYELHGGVGAELRFHWLAFQADVRGIALLRDETEAPGSYYAGVDGGPVPAQSYGAQATFGASIWF